MRHTAQNTLDWIERIRLLSPTGQQILAAYDRSNCLGNPTENCAKSGAGGYRWIERGLEDGLVDEHADDNCQSVFDISSSLGVLSRERWCINHA
jgi:hypothetical protein